MAVELCPRPRPHRDPRADARALLARPDGRRVRGRVPAGAGHAARGSLAFGSWHPAPARRPHRSTTSTADDLDATHDPGPDVARARLEAAALDEAATEPLAGPSGHRIRVGTASWTDPTMTAAGVFYPTDASTAEDRLRLLRVALPGRRGGRDVLRAPLAPAVGAVGRADAARLRVRHQGARAADRPADGDEAAAEGAPRGAPRDARGEVTAVREGPARASSWPRSGASSRTASRRSPRRASWARSSSSTPSGSSPRPRTATRSGRRRRPSSRSGCGSPWSSATQSWFNEKNVGADAALPGRRARPAGHGRRAAGVQVVACRRSSR